MKLDEITKIKREAEELIVDNLGEYDVATVHDFIREDQGTIIALCAEVERLREREEKFAEAFKFYCSEWDGEGKPTERLLEDCGTYAMETLQELEANDD